MASLLSSLVNAQITASMVVGLHGEHLGTDGTSKSLGGQEDFELLMFFRKRSNIVLTTGKTARAENYRLPSTVSLAVLTRLGRNSLPPALQVPEVLLLGSEGEISPATAIKQLSKGSLGPVHIEFGPSALLETLAVLNEVRTFISSEHKTGGPRFAVNHQLRVVSGFRYGKLYVTEVSGRA